jgi:hypothetical protein
VTAVKTCKKCGAQILIKVPRLGYEMLWNGTDVNVALPNLNDDEKVTMVTSICRDCQK